MTIFKNPAKAPAQKRVRPAWLEDLTTFYRGRIARQFVLHFNITDYVIDLSDRRDIDKDGYTRTGNVVNDSEVASQTLREYLYQFLFREFSCKHIYTYSLANGLTADDALQIEQEETTDQDEHTAKSGMQLLYETYNEMHSGHSPMGFVKQQNRSEKQNAFNELPTDIPDILKLLGHLLRLHPEKENDSAFPPQENDTPLAVILDYVEKLIPYHLGEGQGDREQLQALETVQRWALDPLIRQSNNVIILLTTNIGLIPSNVYAEGSGCRAIRVPLPDEYEREAFIRYKMTLKQARLVPLSQADFGLTEAEKARRLARATQGMRLTDIDNMSRRIAAEFQKRRNDRSGMGGPQEIAPLLTKGDVQKVKAEVIQAQSAGLLEIVPPVRSFNEIGGLDNLKRYLSKRTKLMLSGQHSPLVPSGLLLAGPPGTGKTMIAEALATESGFNLVKMRSIQDKWVGSSERNLELVINLLKDLHPVVVFVDEIDQAMVRRDSGQSGDSGVGARMFARLLEEMSSPANRGRILWVAATNRADIIDEAMLRRFDRVVPLLTPDVNETCRIFATMISTIVKQSGGNIQVEYGGDLAQNGSGDNQRIQANLDKFLPVAKITAELGLTGAGIEIVVRRAIELAYEEILEQESSAIPSQVPAVELRHLLKAVQDYKPNHNRNMYDYQSLLALRACNFHSVIPTLPRSDIFARIQRPNGTIDTERLEEEIGLLEQQRSLRQ